MFKLFTSVLLSAALSLAPTLHAESAAAVTAAPSPALSAEPTAVATPSVLTPAEEASMPHAGGASVGQFFGWGLLIAGIIVLIVVLSGGPKNPLGNGY